MPASILGAGVLSDAYFAALEIPNLFRRLLAEGALNSAFVTTKKAAAAASLSV
jgi:putative peptidoglycan lipid II flippase